MIRPTIENIAYGPHKRNVLDVYIAPGEHATPVFLWIHGGGFASGDKTTRAKRFVDPLFERGISLVSTNYRLSHHAIYPAPFIDCQRALQFVRFHARSWGLDPVRLAVGGLSAGAGISLWLAFRPDMANPDSDDLVERQSTRPVCVFIAEGQTSYDPRFIAKVVGGRAHLEGCLPQLFGVSREDWPKLNEEKAKLVEDASAIEHLRCDAPPVFALYLGTRTKVTDADPPIALIHHPRFGDDLKVRMDRLGLDCKIWVREEGQYESDGEQISIMNMLMAEFLGTHLKPCRA